MTVWIERLPERLQFELDEFAHRCLDFAPDRDQLERHRRLIMRGGIEIADGAVELEVVYPDTFPYLRPEVFARGLTLARHQNPYDHNLCLLDRSTREWNTSDTGAWLVAERVPRLLEKLKTGGSELRDAEAPQGEPITSYFQYEPGSVVFVPEEALALPGQAHQGRLELAVGAGETFQPRLRAGLVRVTMSEGGKKRVLATMHDPLKHRFSGARIEGTWLRLPNLPASREPLELLEAAAATDPGAAKPRWQSVAGAQMALVGLLVTEEVRQNESEDAWLFVVRVRRGVRKGVWQEQAYVVRGDRLTRSDLMARIPDLETMPLKTVAQVGHGALGAPLAMELARAQVGELRLMDPDWVEGSTIVRWSYGLSAVGFFKAEVLAAIVAQDFPFTATKAFRHRVGEVWRLEAGGPREEEILAEFLRGADLLIDTAAELGVSQLLADLATAAQLPFLTAWGTEGGWGGVVASIVPSAPGCWYCLQLHLNDGSLPAPPLERGVVVQPRGCAAPTFTGTSYDLLEIVTQAMRVARRLLGGASSSLVHVCAIRDADGNELPSPQWSTHMLEVHSQCPVCRGAAAA